MEEITLAGPGKNALGTSMMRSLVERLERVSARPLLLTGSGDAFSAGLDLRELASLDAAGTERFLRLLEQCVSALYLHPAPTVALVNGHAIAGGCVLALCCDHRVAPATSRARIGLNEVALGVRFPPRTLAAVLRRMPPRHHEEVLLGAGLYGVEDAARLGLLDAVADDARAAAHAWLERVSSHPAAAYAATKADLRGSAPSDLASDAQLDRWMAQSLPLWASAEVRERIAAALRR